MNDIRQAEGYLQRTLSPEEALVFEARLLTNPLLRLDLYVQRKVYTLLRFYHRQKVKEEMEDMHQRLFRDPAKADFQRQIISLFKHEHQ